MSRADAAESEAGTSPSSGGQSPDANGTPRNRNSKSSKARLTSHQKNTNHKDAENKRRTAIRARFLELSQLVPNAENQERSEQVMLTKTKEYLEEVTEQCRQLENLARQQGIFVPEEFRTRETEFGGTKWKQPNLQKYEKARNKKIAKGTALPDDVDGDAEEDN